MSKVIGQLLRKEQAALAAETAARYSGDARLDQAAQPQALWVQLAEAVAYDAPALFVDYVGWAKARPAASGISDGGLPRQLELMRELLPQRLPAEAVQVADRYVARALEQWPRLPLEPPTFLDPASPFASVCASFVQLLLQGKGPQAADLVLKSIVEGTKVRDIYLQIVRPCLYEIGRLWQLGRITEAQEHYCARAADMILGTLSWPLFLSGKGVPTFVGLCVCQERHELGMRTVVDFFLMHGWAAVHLGADVPAQNLETILQTWQPAVLGISVTMTANLPEAERFIEHAKAIDRDKKLKILVGGHPFNLCPELWRSMGADGCAPDAEQAVAVAREWQGPIGS